MVVLEVRILDKLAATYGPSFESMRRSGTPNQVDEETGSAIKWLGNLTGVPPSLSILAEDRSEIVATLRFEGCGSHRSERHVRSETKTRGKGRIRSATRQPCHGALFNDCSQISRWRPGHHGSSVESRVRVRISASRFTRSLSVLWHASGRNWHPAEARGKSFF
jgi:hypothetical protein